MHTAQQNTGRRARGAALFATLALFLAGVSAAVAQTAEENCIASLQNRSVPVGPGGTFALPNVPVDAGLFRVRVICKDAAGNSLGGNSPFFALSASAGATEVGPILVGGEVAPVPVSITIAAPTTELTSVGETVQLEAQALLPDGNVSNVTDEARGSHWMSSNSRIASVNQQGLVTAHKRGTALIQVRNDGVLAAVAIQVLIPDDTDGDGLPDDYERAMGLNPNDPSDGAGDRDGDGLSALDEYQAGTDPTSADTDGDGIDDGDELSQGSNPRDADSDDDGALDGAEVRLGSDPLDADSDDDGLRDGEELALGLDPRAANPTTTVQGQVIDAAGAAVAGAVAVINDRFTATTGNDGRFSFAHIPADQGAITVFARLVRGAQVADGSSAATPAVGAGITDVGQISLASVVGRVTGTVLSPRGQPVARARVTVSVGADQRAVNADATGVFQVDNLPAGRVSVLATDIRSGLRGRNTGTLPAEGSVVINVGLTAAGAVIGTVLDQALSPAGRGIDVRLSGPTIIDVTTDAVSDFRFDFVPLGEYLIDASDAAGNRGRASATLTGTNQVVASDLVFLGRGTVNVLVEGATGNPVAGAQVLVRSHSLFGGDFTATTGAAGSASIPGVFIGSFSVYGQGPVTRLAGNAEGVVVANDGVTDVTVTLAPAATLAGTVFANDGSTPMAGIQVSLTPSGRRTTTDASGGYSFPLLPLGGYTIDALNTTNGDRQRAVAVLAAPDTTVTQHLVLNGLGRVVVTVRDAGEELVPEAQVTLTSGTPFGTVQRGITGTDGSLVFQNVLAGPFSVAAMDPVDALGGNISSAVLAGEDLAITVSLEDAGEINGKVYAADGSTPIAGARVTLQPLNRQVTTGTDGGFSFPMIPTARSPYRLIARDAAGALRAGAENLTLNGHGATLTQDLLFSGLGTVTGTVTNPDGSIAPGAAVTLDSAVDGMPDRQGVTNDQGVYSFPAIPVGPVTVSAQNRALRYGGSASGDLTTDGQVLTVDVAMLADVLPPTSQTSTIAHLYDVNNFDFAVQQTGEIRDGTSAVFRGDNQLRRGGMRLTLIEDGVTPLELPFSGAGGGFEEAGREVVIPGGSLAGLNVTRKVYVPLDGYFARYLEVLENPGDTPVTVDVRLDTHFNFFREIRDGVSFFDEPRVVSTTDQDAVLEGSDTWVVIDDLKDADPALVNNLPTTAHVFDGAGGSIGGDAELFVDFKEPYRVNGALRDDRYGVLHTNWQGVTVPAGGRVILMHFDVQQTNRTAAIASAERLAQLPPEALAGLSAAEREAIANFAVPLDGASPVTPLPLLDGELTGTVLEGDGSTPVPGAKVYYRSTQPLFQRLFEIGTDGNGDFEWLGRVQNGSSRPVPRAGVTLSAIHSGTGADSGPVSTDFAGAQTLAQQILFTGTGQVEGTVRRPDGSVVSSGTVTISGGALTENRVVNIAVDGLYRAGGLPPATYTLTARLPLGTTAALTGVGSATVAAGAVAVADLTLQPTGTVEGRLRDAAGNLVVNARVDLTGTGFSRFTTTDTAGFWRFTDVPEGNFVVGAAQPVTLVVSSANVTVQADQTTTQDLAFIGLGFADVLATFQGGGIAAQSRVDLRSPVIGNFFREVGRTNFQGELRVGNIPVGAFTLRVYHPLNLQVFNEFNGTITSHGQVVPAPVSVPTDLPPSSAVLTAPANGAQFFDGDQVTLQATAIDDRAINRVEFRVDGQTVVTDWSAPYTGTAVLRLPTVGNTRSLTAVAFDSAGQSTPSAPVQVQLVPDTTPPTIGISAPAAGANYVAGGLISVLATAGDNVGVEYVTFAANGVVFATDYVASYGALYFIPSDYTLSGNRSLVLTATAYDRSGRSATSTVTVNVIPDQPPTITLTQAPTANSNLVEGTTVAFAASASDDLSTPTVDLLIDGVVQQTRFRAPYSFVQVLPARANVTNPIQVVLRARDSRGQTASTTAVPLNIITDLPPTVALTAPTGGDVVEGTSVPVTATAGDDIGIAQVQFRVDGVPFATDTIAPFTASLQVGPGADGSAVIITAEATDSRGQTTVSAPVTLTRRDDTVAPTVALTAPTDGAVISVGASDVVIAIETAFSTSSSCGGDFDGDGATDTILKCEVRTAQNLLDFLDPATTRVGVVAFTSSAYVYQQLTGDFLQVRSVLDALLAQGSSGSASLNSAMVVATNELVGPRARPGATPVQLLFSDGGLTAPPNEIQRAAEGGVVINTFAVGPGVDATALQTVANGTGGSMTRVTNPAAIVDVVPTIIRFGVDALPVVANASDDVAVQQVDFRVRSTDGTTIDQSVTDSRAPFAILAGLPTLTAPVDVDLTASALDFGGNQADSAAVRVTVRPAENQPALVRLSPTRGAAGNLLTITGRFFDPVAARNLVVFPTAGGTVEVVPASATKLVLQVTVPAGAVSGAIGVQVNGVTSNTLPFIVDSDADGLSDEEEAALGTNPNLADTDGDGLNDFVEVNTWQTNPLVADSDGDGVNDGAEVANGLDPNDNSDAALDPDGDGLTNAEEIALGTNRNVADTDTDGLGDGAEVNTHGTDPRLSDTDGGGRSDGSEINYDGTDPLDPDDDRLGVATDEVWVMDYASGHILRLSPLGGVEIGVPRAAIQAVNGGYSPNLFDRGMAFDRQGNLYFSEANSGALLVREMSGVVRMLASNSAIRTVTGAGYTDLQAVAVGADGQVYVNDRASQSVLRVDPLTGAVGQWVTRNALRLALQVNDVDLDGGLVAGADGTIYTVSDGDPVSVIAIAADGTPSLVTSAGTLSGLRGYATRAETGDLLINDDDYGAVWRVTPTGQVSAFLNSTQIAAANGGTFPDLEGGLGLNTLNDLYLVEENESRVLRFDVGGNSGIFADRTAMEAITGVRPDLEGDLAVAPPFDLDRDGLDAFEEASAGTDPADPDSDDDGLSDGFEVANGLNPLLAGDEGDDPDGDGLDNLGEQTAGTDPNDADSDDDGLNDGDEVARDTDPLRADTDGDGLSDAAEVNTHGTSPLLADSDADGIDDARELALGFNPLDPADGTGDPDNDGLSTANELGRGTAWDNPDSDDDGLWDGVEVITQATDPLRPDTDGDALIDGVEFATYGTSPLAADSDGGGRNDGHEVLVDGTDPLVGADDSARVNDEDLVFPEYNSGAVMRVNRDGVVRVLISRTEVQSLVGYSPYYWARSAAVGSDGTVYVAEGNSGALIGKSPGQAARIVATQAQLQANTASYSNLRGLEVGTDGFVYGLDSSNSRLLRIDPATGDTTVFVSQQQFEALPEMGYVNIYGGLASATDGTLYTPAYANPSALLAVAPDATPRVVASGYDRLTSLYNSNLAVDPNGDLLITEPGYRRVYRVRPDGTVSVALRPVDLELAGGTSYPDPSGGVAVRADGVILLGDYNNGDILRFAADGGDGRVFVSRTAIQAATGAYPYQRNEFSLVPEQDGDGDGLGDLVEVGIHGTDPANPDSDFDGLSDGFEVANGFDPLDPDDAARDTDEDGLTDAEEILNGLDPNDPTDADADPDSDGVSSRDEVRLHSTNPRRADTDGDRLSDGDEIFVYLTSPLQRDTDGGSREDGDEVLLDGTDPNDPNDDSAVLPVSDSTTDADQAVSAVDGDGNLHLVWVDLGGEGGLGLRYQLRHPHGDLLIDTTALIENDGAHRPSIAVDSLGHVHLVWQQYGGGDCTTEVYRAVFDPGLVDWNGEPADPAAITLVPATRLSSDDCYESSTPRVAVDRFDRVHVVWADVGDLGAIRYSRFDADGSLAVDGQLVADSGYNSRAFPVVATDRRGDAHVAWADGNRFCTYEGMYAMLDGQSGAPRIAPTRFTDDDCRQSVRPSIAVTPDGIVNILMQDKRLEGGGGEGAAPAAGTVNSATEVFLFRLDPDLDDRNGTAADLGTIGLALNLPVSPDNGLDSVQPQLAVADTVDGVVLYAAYHDDWDGGGPGRPMLMRLAADGQPLGPEIPLSTGASGAWDSWTTPSVAARGVNAWATWTEPPGSRYRVLLRVFGRDSDRDGLGDRREQLILGTDWSLIDSDFDSLGDGFEVRRGLDPLNDDTDSNDVPDGQDDFDGDGLDNAAEEAQGTDPTGLDTDFDNLSDGDEVYFFLTDPLNGDTDGDGLDDGEDFDYGSDPANPDSDGDGLIDGYEIQLGLSPLTPDSDGDGTDDGAEDFEPDGLPNTAEFRLGLDPYQTDSDFNGVGDGDEDYDGDTLGNAAEVNVYGTDPARLDTDRGGRNDGDELFLDGTDPLDGGDDLPLVSFGQDLYDFLGYHWYVDSYGSITDGNAYSGGMYLIANGNWFYSPTGRGVLLNNGREAGLTTPYAYLFPGLRVSRRVFVPDDDSFARYLDMFDNFGTQDQTVTVRIQTYPSTGSQGVLVTTADGDGLFETNDDWLVFDDATDFGGRPTLAQVVAGPGAGTRPTAVSAVTGQSPFWYEYQVTVPAGGRAILMHFAIQNPDRASAALKATSVTSLPPVTLRGISAADAAAIVNFVVPAP